MLQFVYPTLYKQITLFFVIQYTSGVTELIVLMMDWKNLSLKIFTLKKFLQEKCVPEKSQKLEPAKILCHKVMYLFDKLAPTVIIIKFILIIPAVLINHCFNIGC